MNNQEKYWMPKEGEVVVNKGKQFVAVYSYRNWAHVYNVSEWRLASPEEIEWMNIWSTCDPKKAMAILPFQNPIENLPIYITNGLLANYNDLPNYEGLIKQIVQRTIEPMICDGRLVLRSELKVETKNDILDDGWYYKIEFDYFVNNMKFSALIEIDRSTCDDLCETHSYFGADKPTFIQLVDAKTISLKTIQFKSPFEANIKMAIKANKAILSRLKFQGRNEYELNAVEDRIEFFEGLAQNGYTT